MHIGEKTLEALGQLATNALLAHEGPLNMAFKKNGDSDLKIGLKATIKPGAADGNFKLKIDIDYVIEKATDSFTDSVDEKQQSLPLAPMKYCPLRDGDQIFQTHCNSKCHSRVARIFVSGKKLPVVLPWNSEAPVLAEGEMVQFMSCPAWADEDYKDWMDVMVKKAEKWIVEHPTPKPDQQLSTYRIRNKETNKFWEGNALSVVSALKVAGWTAEKCELKVLNKNHAWCKCRELEGAPGPEKNSCGMDVIKGVCSHLYTEAFTGQHSTCSDDNGVEIKCCRDCTADGCGSRCVNSEVKAKKDKKKKAA